MYVRLVTGLTIADTQCGFKLFTHEAAKRIVTLQRVNGFGFDVERLFLARKMNLSVAAVPVRWNYDAQTKVNLVNGLMAFVDVLQVVWSSASGKYDEREEHNN